nr:MAG TPA: hypothetical protein [Caudoviricetes sp.]
MTKICDTCDNYARKHQFCFFTCTKVDTKMLNYCKGYKPIKSSMKGRGKSCKSYTV